MHHAEKGLSCDSIVTEKNNQLIFSENVINSQRNEIKRKDKIILGLGITGFLFAVLAVVGLVV